MEVNKEYQIASIGLSQHVKKTGKPIKKPSNSKLKDIKIILLTKETTSVKSSLLTINEINKRSLNCNFLENKVMINVNSVMNPNPPIWINKTTTNCPAKVNSSPMPLTKLFKPVTHVADVAKNKQSIKLPKFFAVRENGIIKRIAPIKIMIMNDKMTSR